MVHHEREGNIEKAKVSCAEGLFTGSFLFTEKYLFTSLYTSAAGNFHFCCGTFCAGSRDTKLHRGGRKVQSRPSRCTASCRGPTSSCTPSLSGPRKTCVQVTRYWNPTSILFLMIRGLGWNLLFSCSTTLNVKTFRKIFTVSAAKNVFEVLHSSTDLSDQLVVLQLLPALHDSHDARLDLVLPVLVNLQRTAIERSPMWLLDKLFESSLLNKPDIIA